MTAAIPLLWAVLTAGSGQRIVVLDVKPRVGVTTELAQGISDDVVVEVRRRAPKGTTVVGSDEIRSMVGLEQEKSKLGCQDVSCLAEIGGALGAGKMVIGTLGRFGSTYLLTLQLVTVQSAHVDKQASLKLHGKTDDELLEAVGTAVDQLFPGEAAASLPAVAPVAAVTAPEAPPARSHVLRWTLLGTGIAAAAVGALSLGEVLSYLSLNGQLAAQQIPTGVTYQSAQVQQRAANSWGTAGIALAGVAVACGVGTVIAW